VLRVSNPGLSLTKGRIGLATGDATALLKVSDAHASGLRITAQEDHVAEQDGPSPTVGDLAPQKSSNRDRASHPALAGSVAALSTLAVGNLDLTDMLTQVATLAVNAIPGADGAGLTLLRIARADLIVKSEPFVRAIDDIQYGIGEGPCISAATTGQTRRSGQLNGDSRWPQFGPKASGLGVHSALSLPLVISTGVLGAINVYAHDPNSFDDHSQKCGETFAVSAALAVQNAQILDQVTRLIDQLRAGIRGRVLIEQAIGVLRRRNGNTAGQALDRLNEISHTQQISLTTAATSVLDSACHQAQPDQR
jgi:GAF domain-containing protein